MSFSNLTFGVTGDFIEQHPFLFAALFQFLSIGLTMAVPGFWLLRLLLRIFGFGSGGPMKGAVVNLYELSPTESLGAGTAASWAQGAFYGAAVSKGSWFSSLQKAAMT
jgi:hypothetical protein